MLLKEKKQLCKDESRDSSAEISLPGWTACTHVHLDFDKLGLFSVSTHRFLYLPVGTCHIKRLHSVVMILLSKYTI